ncbi:MAG: GGDEF domain-containing protein, partial [Pseudomonadota bacterium]
MSRKAKLLAGVGLLLATGFLFTSLTSYFVSRTSLRAEISSRGLPLTSDNIYSEIQRDLLRPVFISSLMATDTFLRDWLIHGETNPEKIIKYLNEIRLKYNMFTSFLVSEKTKNYYHFDGVLKTISQDQERDNWYFRVKDMKEDYEINVDPDIA